MNIKVFSTGKYVFFFLTFARHSISGSFYKRNPSSLGSRSDSEVRQRMQAGEHIPVCFSNKKIAHRDKPKTLLKASPWLASTLHHPGTTLCSLPVSLLHSLCCGAPLNNSKLIRVPTRKPRFRPKCKPPFTLVCTCKPKVSRPIRLY